MGYTGLDTVQVVWESSHRVTGLGRRYSARRHTWQGPGDFRVEPFDLSESQGWTKGSDDVLGDTGYAPGSSLLS